MSAPLPSRRRGGCPALTAPMATGDGLLVRLVPKDGLSPDQLSGLACAARMFGNGILEVTARGSLQLRGLQSGTVALLNAAVAGLAIQAREGLAIDVSPLSGSDARERRDARALARIVNQGLTQRGVATRLGPKVSIVIDGGGAVSLDTLSADIRLSVRQDGDWDLALAGDATHATHHRAVADEAAGEAILDLLSILAARGPAARMRDIAVAEVGRDPTPVQRTRNQRLVPGQSVPLRDGTFALALALPFGAVDSTTLEALATRAREAGIHDLRPAPGRLLLAVGLGPGTEGSFIAAAQSLGFILDPRDPRLSVIACPGAPLCASARLPARAIANDVARTLSPLLDGTPMVHLSGCPKGCAHPASAPLTIVGHETPAMDSAVALMRHAKADAPADNILALPDLIPTLARLAARRQSGETLADLLSRSCGTIREPTKT